MRPRHERHVLGEEDAALRVKPNRPRDDRAAAPGGAVDATQGGAVAGVGVDGLQHDGEAIGGGEIGVRFVCPEVSECVPLF